MREVLVINRLDDADAYGALRKVLTGLSTLAIMHVIYGSWLPFEFDTAVKHLTLTTASSGLRVVPHSTAHTVTCILRRDPFTTPASWEYTVWMTLEALPATGHIAVGSFETHDVVYQMAPRPVAALVSRPKS